MHWPVLSLELLQALETACSSLKVVGSQVLQNLGEEHRLRDCYGDPVDPRTIEEQNIHPDAGAPYVEHITDMAIRESERVLRIRQRDLSDTIYGNRPTWIGQLPTADITKMDHDQLETIETNQAQLRALKTTRMLREHDYA